MVLWVESRHASVVGDALPDFGSVLHIDPRWLDPDLTREQVVEQLRPLLEKPVEIVLAPHGAPSTAPPSKRVLS